MQKEVEVPMIPETKDTKMQAYRDSPKEHQSKIDSLSTTYAKFYYSVNFKVL